VGTGECDAWLYAHIKLSTIPVTAGQWVEAGQYLGDLVDWPYHPGQVEHLHFSRIRYFGDSLQWAIGQDDWEFVASPFEFLTIDNDTVVPAFTDAYGNQLFAFCENETSTYFSEGSFLSGDVDIVCRAHDYHNWFDWCSVPYCLEYRIEGDSMIPWTQSVRFVFEFGRYDDMGELSYIIFQDDDVCDTHNDYGTGNHAFFFNLTNSDGDSAVEQSDKLLSWQTASFHNGEYTIHVRAKDKTGNTVVESMTVNVENLFELTGSVSYADGNPNLSGAVISVQSSGQSDTTDADGMFMIPSVGGGSQNISINRLYYEEIDTMLMMNQNREVLITMEHLQYSCGDADSSGGTDIDDVVYLIAYIFSGDQEPVPYESGDADCSGEVDIDDVVWLIAYIFSGGSAPCDTDGDEAPDC
jgi:hypothetical protein